MARQGLVGCLGCSEGPRALLNDGHRPGIVCGGRGLGYCSFMDKGLTAEAHMTGIHIRTAWKLYLFSNKHLQPAGQSTASSLCAFTGTAQASNPSFSNSSNPNSWIRD